jgi:ubiquinone/menaquinone biosynthesis C-methylase UbiE
MTAQSEFWSKVARKYDHVADLQLGGATRALVRERAEREERLGLLVEFGCGSGFYTEALARKADRVVATDLAPGMLALSRERVRAANVEFQEQDAQQTSFSDEAFDTAFMSLVLHFTEPAAALAEMRRILRPGATLIVVNLDPMALGSLDRIRSAARIFYRGATGYRTKPPRGFGSNVLSERQLCALLGERGFEVLSSEPIRDASRSSNVPVEYVRARKL